MGKRLSALRAPLVPERVRRIAGQSFSFIPHRFLHDGFLEALGHDELALYLFLVLAGLLLLTEDMIGLKFGLDPALALKGSPQSIAEAGTHQGPRPQHDGVFRRQGVGSGEPVDIGVDAEGPGECLGVLVGFKADGEHHQVEFLFMNGRVSEWAIASSLTR